MIIGEAIADSGPAIVVSFILAGVTCIFSALAYAELASGIPVSGSAYTYLMTKLPGITWLRFGDWLLLGGLVYALYGYRNSRLRRGDDDGGGPGGGGGRFDRGPSGSPAADSPAPASTR